MKDRAMQALYRLSLEPVAETTADYDSYGFRSKRCTADAIQACFDRLRRKGSVKWILEADIKGCFDNILHPWLLTHIPLEQRVLRQWLNAGYIEKGKLFPTQAGTPQGGIISPMLANMALDGLQKRIESLALRPDKRPWFKIVRYADDFIITGPSKEALEQKVLPAVQAFLKERGLALAPDKTRLTHIDEGFDFLGQNVRKYQGKLFTKPAKKNLHTFLGNIRQTVKTLRQAKAEKVINVLNPKILGWCNYHRYIVAKKAFSHVDNVIYHTLWRWAKRRHPMKNRHWIRHKYFKSVQKRNWVFSAEVTDKSGRKQLIHLRKAMDVKIRRHFKIRRDAHPFAPEFRQYFKLRDNQPTSQRCRLSTKEGFRKA
jgi:RNA-directed DNA polymerase